MPIQSIYVLHLFVLIDFSLTVKAATLIFIFIFGRGSAISSANEGKTGLIYNRSLIALKANNVFFTSWKK